MIFRVEINSQTKAGRKVYELIESLWGKDGITYLDEDEYLSKEEEKELKEELIQIFDDINNESLSETKEVKITPKFRTAIKELSRWLANKNVPSEEYVNDIFTAIKSLKGTSNHSCELLSFKYL